MKEKKHFFSWLMVVMISLVLLIITIVLPTLLLERQEGKMLSYRVFEKQENLSAESMPLTFEQKMILFLHAEDKMKLENGEIYTKEEALNYIKSELGNIPFIAGDDMKGQLTAEAELYLYNLQSNIFWNWGYADEKVKISGILDEQSGKNIELSITFLDRKEVPDFEPEQCAKDWGSYLNLSYREVRKNTASIKKQADISYTIFYNFPGKQSIVTFMMPLSEGGLSVSLFDVVT